MSLHYWTYKVNMMMKLKTSILRICYNNREEEERMERRDGLRQPEERYQSFHLDLDNIAEKLKESLKVSRMKTYSVSNKAVVLNFACSTAAQ